MPKAPKTVAAKKLATDYRHRPLTFRQAMDQLEAIRLQHRQVAADLETLLWRMGVDGLQDCGPLHDEDEIPF